MPNDNVNYNVKGDLISREALLDDIRSAMQDTMYFSGGARAQHKEKIRWAFDKVRKAPAVDVAPVVHGRWIPECEEMETLVGVYGYTQVKNVLTGWRCSVCGRCEELPREEMPYCHCGAKMDLEVPRDV